MQGQGLETALAATATVARAVKEESPFEVINNRLAVLNDRIFEAAQQVNHAMDVIIGEQPPASVDDPKAVISSDEALIAKILTNLHEQDENMRSLESNQQIDISILVMGGLSQTIVS